MDDEEEKFEDPIDGLRNRTVVAQVTDNVAAARRINLLEEQARGGHTVQRHVGKSRSYLMSRINRSQYRGLFFSWGLRRAGSFTSLSSATSLVNSTLAQNQTMVAAVATGAVADAFVTATFARPTGYEAYIYSYRSAPVMRETFGVGVYIAHDLNSPRGYTVFSAWPRSDL